MGTERYRNKPTIADVSRLAGVSMSTVSHVINDTRYVSEEIRERVHKAILETGYTQNLLAKSLKQARSKNIGVIISDFTNPFYVDVISGIEGELGQAGYSMILAATNDNAERELQIVKNFVARQIDGLIFAPTIFSEKVTVPYLVDEGIPAVMINRFVNTKFNWVGVENVASTKMLVNHLINLGHRRIAIVVGLRNINTSEERIAGYQQAMREAGIPEQAGYIIEGGSRIKPAEENVLSFFQHVDPAPTALVAANNLMTLGAMRALNQLGMRIPQDLAFVSFDDFAWSDLFSPRITALAQPCLDIGKKAAELLVEQIDAPPDTVVYNQHIAFSPTLIVRDSCGFTKQAE